ncbi:hypothetical protein [Nocardia coubleae]|uniref:Uncharacterized protein n=1 Tax=Nocardia coubleae TaxID=356147 RepID=A0A846W4R7_9NOCA|nr:hypothetical protein [Nocardia coubleae]NKX88252.1 hypothetical protein [Nocardia coubleae]
MTDQGHSLDTAPTSPPSSAPFATPAPDLVGITDPDSTFVETPGSSDRMAGHMARRMSVRPALAALVLILPVYLLLAFWLDLPAITFPLVTVVLALYLYASISYTLRKRLRSLRDHTEPPPTQTLRLGADALDVADRTAHTRIAYDRIRSITVSRAAVTLRLEMVTLSMPRQLWPDESIAALRDLVGKRGGPELAPLPPLPVPAEPHTSTVAGSDTARLLAAAAQLEPWRRPGAKIAVVAFAVIAIEFAVICGGRYGAPGVVLPLVIGTIVEMLFWRRAHTPSAALVDHAARAAFPNATMSAVFGSDAAIFATPAWIMRIPYTVIGKITIRPEVTAVVFGRVPIMLPTALFPPHIANGLAEHGIRVDHR